MKILSGVCAFGLLTLLGLSGMTGCSSGMTVHQDAYAKFIQSKTGSMADYMRIVIRRFNSSQSDEQQQKALNPTEVPEFVEQPRPLGDVISASMFDLGLLVVLNAIFFGGAFFSFLKFDLR